MATALTMALLTMDDGLNQELEAQAVTLCIQPVTLCIQPVTLCIQVLTPTSRRIICDDMDTRSCRGAIEPHYPTYYGHGGQKLQRRAALAFLLWLYLLTMATCAHSGYTYTYLGAHFTRRKSPLGPSASSPPPREWAQGSELSEFR